MKRAGIYLLVIGVGAFILPSFGLQFRILPLLGSSTYIVAGLVALAGLGLIIGGTISKGEGKTPEEVTKRIEEENARYAESKIQNPKNNSNSNPENNPAENPE